MPSKKTKTRHAQAGHMISLWPFTREAVVVQESALELSRDLKLSPENFQKLLQTMDMYKSLYPKLDPEKVARIPPDSRELFIRQYLSATITWMVEDSNLLGTLKSSRLTMFPKQADRKNLDSPETGRERPKDDLYAEVDPAIAPIADRIPCFHGTFLGMLQTRLQKAIESKGIHPVDNLDIDEEQALAELVHNKLPPERIFGEVRAATSEYLRWVSLSKDPAFVTVLSSRVAPYVFMWLNASGLMDDLFYGLVHGQPLMKPMEATDELRRYAYEPTERGKELGLWKLGDEEE